MNIRQRALAWRRKKGRAVGEDVATSKWYSESESWSGRPVWFFTYAVAAAERDRAGFLNLLGEVPGELDFHHFRVPKAFLLSHAPHFDLMANDSRFALYLSADAPDLFRETRGDGLVDFSPFKVD